MRSPGSSLDIIIRVLRAWRSLDRPRRWFRLLPILVLLMAAVSACGPLGDDDDEDPTATAAPVNQPVQSSPVASPVATPRAAPGAGTPRAGAAPTREPDAEEPDAEVTPEETSGVASEGDETPPVAEETPSSEEDEPTEDAAPTTVVVADCEEPEELPERTGRQNRIVAEDGLRLRSGPGTSCDEITSLALETPVRVISGVVAAEGDDNDWVKVDVDGTEGWLAADFLENPPDE